MNILKLLQRNKKDKEFISSEKEAAFYAAWEKTDFLKSFKDASFDARKQSFDAHGGEFHFGARTLFVAPSTETASSPKKETPPPALTKPFNH